MFRSGSLLAIAMLAIAPIVGNVVERFNEPPKLVPLARVEVVQPTTALYVVPPKQRPAKRMVMDTHVKKERQLASWVKRHAKGKVSDEYATRVVQATLRSSEQYNVDPLLMLAVMQVESNFDPNARSSVGAIGLTQVLPKAHPEKIKSVSELTKPEKNIRVGTQIMAEYLRWYNGDLSKALLQYNGSLQSKNPTYHKKVFASVNSIKTHLQTKNV